MNVLMWLSIGLDRRTPSEHLLCSIIESLCEEGHSVHILQKNTGGSLPVIPTSVKNLSITTEIISCRMPKKTNAKRSLKINVNLMWYFYNRIMLLGLLHRLLRKK